MRFNIRREHDLAVEYQLQRRRILFGRAAPIAARGRVEGHQVREPQLDLLRGEAHDCEGRAEVEQAEGGLLAGWRAAGLEDLQSQSALATLLGEGTHALLEFS